MVFISANESAIFEDCVLSSVSFAVLKLIHLLGGFPLRFPWENVWFIVLFIYLFYLSPGA